MSHNYLIGHSIVHRGEIVDSIQKNDLRIHFTIMMIVLLFYISILDKIALNRISNSNGAGKVLPISLSLNKKNRRTNESLPM